MRRIWLAISLAFLMLIPNTSLNAAVPKPGAKCSKAGTTQISKGFKFTCIKKNKNLVWNKGVMVAKPVSTPSPSVKPSPTSSPTQSPTLNATSSPTPTSTPTSTPTISPSPTSSPTATPIPSSSPSVSPSPTPTPSPTPSPSPTSTTNTQSQTPTPSPTPTPSNQQTLVPNLKLKSFNLKVCEIEILNFDSSFQWLVTSETGTPTRVGALVTLTNEFDFPGTRIKVISKKSNFVDGETIVECVPT